MSTPRKRRRGYRSRDSLSKARQVAATLDQAIASLQRNDIERAAHLCQGMLPLVAQRSYQHVELLNALGSAQVMQRQLDAAYETFSQALALLPEDPYLWFNRGMICRHVMRPGQSLHDLQQAVAREGNGPAAEQYATEAQRAQTIVERALHLRGPDFTLEHLIEQEERFIQAIQAMERDDWAEGEAHLQRVLALSERQPQPWSNLGICLMMQRRFDEAEAAYQRALAIQPDYASARENQAVLQQMRQAGA